MGLIPQPTSQYGFPQLDTNPKIRKDSATENRKRAVPTKKFRPSAAPKPSETAMHPPATISKAPVNVKPQTDVPKNRPPPLENAAVHENTPWPSAGRMSGNFNEDRNWLLPPNYLNNNNKNATGITSPKPSIKEEPKIGEQSIISPKRQMWMGTKLSLLQESGQGRLGWQTSKTPTAENITSAKNAKASGKIPPRTHRSLTKRHQMNI